MEDITTESIKGKNLPWYENIFKPEYVRSRRNSLKEKFIESETLNFVDLIMYAKRYVRNKADRQGKLNQAEEFIKNSFDIILALKSKSVALGDMGSLIDHPTSELSWFGALDCERALGTNGIVNSAQEFLKSDLHKSDPWAQNSITSTMEVIDNLKINTTEDERNS